MLPEDLEPVTRRIMLKLPKQPPAPFDELLKKKPYAEFLIEHADRLMQLEKADGSALIHGLRCQMAQTQTHSVYITDIRFTSPEDYRYYSEQCLPKMLEHIAQYYPNAADHPEVFNYTRALKEADSGTQDLLIFEGITKGLHGLKEFITRGNTIAL